MPAEELPDNACGFEERLRALESALDTEQEWRRMLEERVRQLEAILKGHGAGEAADDTDDADDRQQARAWLMKRAYPHQRERLARLAARIDRYWDGERYAFRVHGHERVETFQLLGEIAHCINVPQTAFIGFIISYTNLGSNRNTIKSNLRYAAMRGMIKCD